MDIGVDLQSAIVKLKCLEERCSLIQVEEVTKGFDKETIVL